MASLNEVGSPRFLLLVSACWNGIAMGAIDIARRHVTTKEHADIGMRIADYPSIQVSRENLGQSLSLNFRRVPLLEGKRPEEVV